MSMFASLRRWLGGRAEHEPSAIQWATAEAKIPALAWLDREERLRLRRLAVAFLAEKQFYGAQGLELDDAMMLEIALQACLLILPRGVEAYRGWVGIVVYPGDFVVPRSVMDNAGVVHEYDEAMLGEAWEGGPVILSWFDLPEQDELQMNVVIHEFAHKLDMANGGADGFPVLLPGMSRSAWSTAFSAAYEALCRELDRGIESWIDPYAGESPAEFFAVCAEAFFLEPEGLAEIYPEVYRQLARYFALDPVARSGAGA